MLEKQAAFTLFYTHFIIKKRPRAIQQTAIEGSTACKYLTGDSKKRCAIGIQPEIIEIYQRKFEGHTIVTLYEEFPSVKEIIRVQDLTFFRELQRIHDRQGIVEIMQEEADELANEYGLEIPAGAK